MNWWFRHRAERDLQADADHLDAALADPTSRDARRFGPELAAARAIADSVTPLIEPPDAARLALRAGVALHTRRRNRPLFQAGVALAAVAAALAAVLGLGRVDTTQQTSATVAVAQASLSNLGDSVTKLEAAIGKNDPAAIVAQLANAQAAVRKARTDITALPTQQRQIAQNLTDQQNQQIQWLMTQPPVVNALAPEPTTTTEAPPSTTVAPTTTPPTTAPPSTTTVAPSTTTTVPSTTTTAPPPTTTTAPPPSTTTSPPSTVAPVRGNEAGGTPGAPTP